jgi:hypothetical protein
MEKVNEMAIVKRTPVTKTMTKAVSDQYIGYFTEMTAIEGVDGIVIHDGKTPGGFLIEDKNTLYIDEIIAQLNLNDSLTGWKVLTGSIAFNNDKGHHDDDDHRHSDNSNYRRGKVNWSTFRSGMMGLEIEESKTSSFMTSYVIPHDYKPGTKVYPNLHFTHREDDESGVVRWGFEFSVAKGYTQTDDDVFDSTSIIYVEQQIDLNTDNKLFLTELPDIYGIPSTKLEPNSLVLLRIFRDGDHPNDTFDGDVFVLKTCLQYQALGLGTVNRLPTYDATGEPQWL